jgi:hypothetical protein
MIAINQEYADAMANIDTSTEEGKAKAAELTAWYTEKMKYYTDEATKFMKYNQESNERFNADMADNFNETLLSKMYPDLQSFEDYFNMSHVAM